MLPSEFDAAMRTLRARFNLRTNSRRRQDGDPLSKHRWDMAEDLGFFPQPGEPPLWSIVGDIVVYAVCELKVWGLWHDAGSGFHFHFQGAAPGRLPPWWIDRHVSPF